MKQHLALCAALSALSFSLPTASLSAQSWQQLTPAGSPPASRIYHTVSYDSQRDRAVVFGGFNGSTVFGDTWEWNPTTNAWSQLSPATSAPSRQVMAYAYDASRGRTVVWGGVSPGGAFLSDTWEWDGTTWTQRSASGPFAGRCASAMVYDSVRQRCILFGGQAVSTFTNDTWEWDGTTWTQVHPGGAGSSQPSPRFFHNMVYDAGRRRVLVFGGSDGSNLLSDTWAFDPQTATWSQLSGTGPSARSQCGMVYDPNLDKTLLYGGEGPSASSLGDTWILDGGVWAQSTASAPPARRRHVIAYRPGTGKSVMFGGQKPSGVVNETWSLDTSSDAVVAPVTATQLTTTTAPVGTRDVALAPLPTGGTLLFGGTTAMGRQPFTFTLSGTTFTAQYPNVNPAFRTEATLTLDTARGNNVLFGGRNPLGAALGDTWTWLNGQWTQLNPSTSPPARSGHKAVYDAQANVVLVYGGKNAAGAALNDFWAWNGTTWTQRTPSVLPPARYGHVMVYDARRARTVVHGGNNGTSRLSDVWEYDGLNWIEASAARRPSERHGMAFAFDATRNKAVLFGGRDGYQFSGETWEYSASVNPSNPGFVWAKRPTVTAPSPRNSSPSAFDNNRGVTVLFGGYEGNTIPLGDTWEWNGSAWNQRVTATRPAPRWGHGMAYDRARGKVVLFGGFDGAVMRNDTWEWDGNTWQQRNTAAAPTARGYFGMTYDAARGVVVAYGGAFYNATIQGDTWEYDGNNWTQRSASSPPGNRRGVAFVWDETRNETLLFGGYSGSQLYQDLWSWNGSTWTQKSATGPVARQEGYFAFDPARGRAVLYGGADSTFQANYSDTWEWTGTAWVQPTLARSDGLWNPGARDGHAAAYDPRSERVVLHGGEDGNGCKQDMWSWDGNTWTRHLAGATAPSARSGAQMWHDASTNELRVFGGGCGTTYANDLWSLQLPVYSRYDVYGSGCTGSLGVPGLVVEAPSRPVIGTTLNLRVTNVPGVILPVIGAYGYSRTTWNGIPLPVELLAVNMPGCFLLQSTEATLTLAAPNGTGTILWPVPVPNVASLLGGEVFLQALIFNLPGYSRWASLTNGVAIRIGDR